MKEKTKLQKKNEKKKMNDASEEKKRKNFGTFKMQLSYILDGIK